MQNEVGLTGGLISGLLIGLVIGLLIGLVAGLLLAKKRQGSNISVDQVVANAEVKTTIEGLTAQITELRTQTAQADKDRALAEAALKKEIESMATLNTNLLNQSTKLAGALDNTQARGKYGEAQLEKILDAAGLQEGIHYEVQTGTTNSEGTAGIPDIKINMPGGLDIYIDSKFPFTNYYAAIKAEDATERARLMKAHTDDLQKHIAALAKRKYHNIEGSVNFVVVFLPFESILAEALLVNKTLLTEAFELNVTLATPSNLLALLRTVRHGYSRSQLAENAHKIQLVAGKLVEKIQTNHEHIETLGKRIISVASAFNQMVGTTRTTVTKDVNEMIELGLPNNQIEAPKFINPEIRSITDGSKIGDFIDAETDTDTGAR